MRVCKFVPRKNWIITGSDDMQVRVFNYNTLERTHMFDAHSDYIRCIAVHPTQPFILTSSGTAGEGKGIYIQTDRHTDRHPLHRRAPHSAVHPHQQRYGSGRGEELRGVYGWAKLG